MFKVKQLSWILSSTLVLAACTSIQKDNLFSGIEIKPITTIRHANGSPKIMYLLGRYHQGKLNYQEAIAAYKRALAVKSDYVEVHNGLGVIYSIQGQHELSVQHFQTAIELAPQETYLHNNLGYAYLIRGNLAEAIKSLNKAVLLDPENKRALLNLALAQARINSDNKVATSQLNSTDSLPLITQELSKAGVNRVNDNTSKFSENADSQLTSVLPRTDSQITYDKNSKLSDSTGIRLEVSNGNGVTGMAKQISVFFREYGIEKIRLTNHQSYNRSQTEVYYRSGNYQQAYQINQLLPMQVKLIESDELRHDIQIKVLIGQDFSNKATYFNRL